MSEGCLKNFTETFFRVEKAKWALEDHHKEHQKLVEAFKEATSQAVAASAAMAEVDWGNVSPLDLIDKQVAEAEERDQKRKREN